LKVPFLLKKNDLPYKSQTGTEFTFWKYLMSTEFWQSSGASTARFVLGTAGWAALARKYAGFLIAFFCAIVRCPILDAASSRQRWESPNSPGQKPHRRK
jgi:hypothetical protein